MSKMFVVWDFIGMMAQMLCPLFDCMFVCAWDTHQKKMYTDRIKELAGSQGRSLLKELVGFQKAGGRTCFLDGVAPGDEADVGLLSAKNTSREYFGREAVDQTHANYMKTRTPHHEIEKVRTHFVAKIIEWGHYFDEDEDVLEMTSPTAKAMPQGMKRIFKQEDLLILNAGLAASVNRGRDDDDDVSLETVAMPADQIMSDTTYAALAADGAALKWIDQLAERFANKFVDEPVYCIISPTLKTAMLESARKVIQSADFVTARGYLEKGELPDINGIHFIAHPLIKSMAAGDAVDSYLAFTREGLTWGEWKSRKTDIGKDISGRAEMVAYTREKANCVRDDDSRVVFGDITAGV